MAIDPEDGIVWLPITGAASTLRVSVDTVRRRIRDGTFVSRKVPSRYGPAWQVQLDRALHTAAERRDPAPAAAGTLAAEELLQIVVQLQERTVELAERVGYLQAQVDMMRGQLQGRDGAP
jgi:hypothetical protein